MGRKKKKHEKEPNHERWLVSYADFITLLFAVFVTLYAMSQTDKRKVEALVASMRESFGYMKTGASSERVNIVESTDLRAMPAIKPEILTPGKGGEDTGVHKNRSHADTKEFREIKTTIEEYLAIHGAQDKVSVEITKRGLVVSLKEAGFFDSGSSEVKKNSLGLLTKVANSLGKYDNPIRVEGNTDNVPIRSAAFKSNWELSTARATNIVHYLIEDYGFSPGKISAVGYGEYRAIADNDSAEGRRKNRRVDIVLLSREAEGGESGSGPAAPATPAPQANQPPAVETYKPA
jgi:chemotaxis protein MotB